MFQGLVIYAPLQFPDGVLEEVRVRRMPDVDHHSHPPALPAPACPAAASPARPGEPPESGNCAGRPESNRILIDYLY
jgi:hypothetical protein